MTSTVASTMPGRAKTILMSWSRNQLPNQPCEPNKRIHTRPEITGEMVKGRSRMVSSRPLPLNSKRVMHQAAATPKTALSGTAIAATNRVSWMALIVSGSPKAAR